MGELKLEGVELILIVLAVEDEFDALVVLHELGLVPLFADVLKAVLQSLVFFHKRLEPLRLELALLLQVRCHCLFFGEGML